MHKNKVILQILNNGVIVETKEYKDVHNISKAYPSVSYYHLREIYLRSMNKNTRRISDEVDQLYKTIRIIDNDKIIKNIFITQNTPLAGVAPL
jgi:hypothetical protein